MIPTLSSAVRITPSARKPKWPRAASCSAVAGDGVRGRGQAPTPHRPVHVAGATRPARAKAQERQVAGCGALGGTHWLQRGPIGARKRRAGPRSVARSRRAILTAPEESKHTPSTARAAPCSECPQILLGEARVARRERATAGHPARLCAVLKATVASGPEPAKPNGSAPGGH